MTIQLTVRNITLRRITREEEQSRYLDNGTRKDDRGLHIHPHNGGQRVGIRGSLLHGEIKLIVRVVASDLQHAAGSSMSSCKPAHPPRLSSS